MSTTKYSKLFFYGRRLEHLMESAGINKYFGKYATTFYRIIIMNVVKAINGYNYRFVLF